MLISTFLAHPGADYFSSAYFGQGNGFILLDNVACNGNETSLISCSYTAPTSSDSHSEDAGVRCPGQQHFIDELYVQDDIRSLIHSSIEEHFHLKLCHLFLKFFIPAF